MSLTLLTCFLAVFVAPVLSQNCTGGRVFSNCGTPCPLTCENHNDPPICLTACSTGCFCPSGTVLHNDMCIDPAQCPATVVPTTPAEPSQSVCTNGKQYSQCGSACPLRCATLYNPPRACPLLCISGCFCPIGMAELGDGCVTPDSCPSQQTTAPATLPPSQPTLPSCTNGKVFQTCGTACPRTCDNYQQEFLPCTRQCVADCFCPSGLVEMGDRCVSPSECPATVVPTTPAEPSQSVCTNGKQYSLCGSACPLRCDTLHDPPRACPLICVRGCFCPIGMAELGDGCVTPDSCPSQQTTAPATLPPSQPTLPSCTNGKVFQTCGTACPRTCDNYQQEFLPCTRQCVADCFCPSGLVEMGDRCVSPSECPATVVPTTPAEPSQSVCTNGKQYSQCGSACPLRCDTLHDPPRPCPLICVRGCFCPIGMAELGDGCVTVDSCPNAVTDTDHVTTSTTMPVCADGKVFDDCGSPCPLTCSNYSLPCPYHDCVSGCFCPGGTVELDDGCVPYKACPYTPTEPPQPTCTMGKVYEQCGTACPLTCANRNNPPTNCIDECVSGCFCPQGLLQYDGRCVTESECPPEPPQPTCTMGKVYEQCGTACPLTCANRNNPPTNCIDECVSGCFCPQGVLQYDGRCVTESECPPEPPQPTCTMGKVYEQCGTACPLTCANHDNPPTNCIDECVSGCFCPQGLLQYDGRCVTESECPPANTCPAGMEYRECGPVCPNTCTSYRTGINPCFSLRCAPAGCYCANDNILVNGQCLPPAVACQDVLTPTVSTSPVLLKMKIRNTQSKEFTSQQDSFLTNVKNVLSRRGYGDVDAGVHSISQDEHLVVVIELSGDGISAEQAEQLASLLYKESGAFTFEIVEVTVNEEPDVDTDTTVTLSRPAIIGISVGAGVLGLIVILLLSIMISMCLVKRRNNTRRNNKSSSMTNLHTVSGQAPASTKGKLVKESLMY